jgi:N-dimethylarginine dimethylaminohydrolase
MDSQPQILMCPPEHYGIAYEINPWMSRARQADHGLAVQQWGQLRAILEQCGARISCLTPVEGLPDLVFTANAALLYRRQAILARFRHPQRQGEEPHDEAWLAAAGFAVDPYYYHLDTCFCPLAPGLAVYYPPAFDDYGRRALADWVSTLIPVEEAEARSFACNAVVVGRNVVTNTGCPGLRAALRQHGYTPHETPLSEFVKAGGSAKCLTLRLDGEEAATWKFGA